MADDTGGGLYAVLRARSHENLTSRTATLAEARAMAGEWHALQVGPAVVVTDAAVLACKRDQDALWRLLHRTLPFTLRQPGGVPGVTYLICFDTPYKHARHYLGFCEFRDHDEWAKLDTLLAAGLTLEPAERSALAGRLAEHDKGHGSRLMEVITSAGTTWQLTRIWAPSDRYFERMLKVRAHGSVRLCYRCSPGNRRGVPLTAPAPLRLAA